MKKPEIILASLVLVALIMKYFMIPFGGVLFVLSISGLAIYYYPIFALTVTGNSLKTLFSGAKSRGPFFYALATGIGLDAILMGLLFKVQMWPMSSSLILLGLFSAVLLMAINAFRFKKTKEAVFKALMIRCSIGFFVGFVTILIPNSSFIEHYYGDHPEYMEAYRYWEANPNDPRAIEELQKEQMKFYEDDSNSN